MARLIDADAFFSEFGELDQEPYNNAQTVDAEPVKHGHWIESDVGLMCSECNHYTETTYYEPFNNEFGRGWALKRPYYCGYCGAKMDEVEDGLEGE